MSANKNKGPIIDPGLCRCCGNMKKCRLLNVEYDHLGQKEVYSDMMMDCFGLLLSNMDGEECDRLVCATCVVRLREALTFRRQVLNCEEAFLLKIQRDGDNQFKVEVKVEEDAESVRDYDDANDADYMETDNPISDDSAIEKPVTKKPTLRSRIKREKLNTESKKRRSVNKKNSVSNSEHLKMKRDLLSRMQKLKAMLNQKLKPAPPIPAPAVVAPRPTRRSDDKTEPPIRRTSPDRMLHYNRVAIVENSFVFPFKNRISNYYCFYCKEIFTDCNELRTHSLTHDPKTFENSMESKRVPKIDITQIDCRLCPEKINDIETFKQHVSSVHKKIIYPAITNEFLKFRLTMDNLNCLECGTSFPFIDKLIEHMTDHFGKFVCDICGACFIEEATLCQHMRGHKKIDENFPCDVCGKNLKSNYSRQLHIATVHEKRPVVACYKCDASFLSYAQRNRHLINVHGDKRKFTCKACDKVFDVRKTMVEHTRKYHLQVCRHQCDICEQRFHAPSQLKEHKASHTGERNFRCEYCDKSYPRRQSLQDHIRSHTNDRRYKCDICNSTFTQNGSLKNHMKTHHQGFDLAAFAT